MEIQEYFDPEVEQSLTLPGFTKTKLCNTVPTSVSFRGHRVREMGEQ
jgi:hypothetical protein